MFSVDTWAMSTPSKDFFVSFKRSFSIRHEQGNEYIVSRLSIQRIGGKMEVEAVFKDTKKSVLYALDEIPVYMNWILGRGLKNRWLRS